MKVPAKISFAALSILAASCTRSGSPAYEKGRADAYGDLKKGKFAFEVYGERASVPTPFEARLKERFQFEIRAVAEGVVSLEIQEHARGFNEVMKAAFEKQHGQDALARIKTEVANDASQKRKEPNQ